MKAHGHAVSGTAAYLAATRILPGLPDDPAVVLAGVLVTSGAALLPDLDHPSSTLSRSAGLASQTVSAAVSTVAGGHRQLTHSLVVVPLVWLAATWAAGIPAVAAWIGGLLVAVAVPLLARSLPVRLAHAVVVGVAPAVWIGTQIQTGALAAPAWLSEAITIGVLAHLAGDLLTVGGIPLLAPLVADRVSLCLFRTGGIVEPVVTAGLAAVAVWLAVPYLEPLGRVVGEWA